MLPGYVMSTMVRGLRELGNDRDPVEGFKRTLDELSNAELDQAIETYALALDLARDRRAFYRDLREQVTP